MPATYILHWTLSSWSLQTFLSNKSLGSNFKPSPGGCILPWMFIAKTSPFWNHTSYSLDVWYVKLLLNLYPVYSVYSNYSLWGVKLAPGFLFCLYRLVIRCVLSELWPFYFVSPLKSSCDIQGSPICHICHLSVQLPICHIICPDYSSKVLVQFYPNVT
jgi:hypothetical protein